jgi:hypothetical protein
MAVPGEGETPAATVTMVIVEEVRVQLFDVMYELRRSGSFGWIGGEITVFLVD